MWCWSPAGFVVVASCVMTFEARDSAAKIVPARFRGHPEVKPQPKEHSQSSSGCQTLPWYLLPGRPEDRLTRSLSEPCMGRSPRLVLPARTIRVQTPLPLRPGRPPQRKTQESGVEDDQISDDSDRAVESGRRVLRKQLSMTVVETCTEYQRGRRVEGRPLLPSSGCCENCECCKDATERYVEAPVERWSPGPICRHGGRECAVCALPRENQRSLDDTDDSNCRDVIVLIENSVEDDAALMSSSPTNDDHVPVQNNELVIDSNVHDTVDESFSLVNDDSSESTPARIPSDITNSTVQLSKAVSVTSPVQLPPSPPVSCSVTSMVQSPTGGSLESTSDSLTTSPCSVIERVYSPVTPPVERRTCESEAGSPTSEPTAPAGLASSLLAPAAYRLGGKPQTSVDSGSVSCPSSPTAEFERGLVKCGQSVDGLDSAAAAGVTSRAAGCEVTSGSVAALTSDAGSQRGVLLRQRQLQTEPA